MHFTLPCRLERRASGSPPQLERGAFGLMNALQFLISGNKKCPGSNRQITLKPRDLVVVRALDGAWHRMFSSELHLKQF